MFGYSNVSYDLDACAGFANDGTTQRASNIKVGGVAINPTDTYSPTTQACSSGNPSYAVAGYWYADDPTAINNCNPCRGRLIQAVKTDGTTVDVAGPGVTSPLPDSDSLLDLTEAVVRYLQAPASQGGLAGAVTSANLPLHRITVKRLPTINPYPFKMVQPLNGSSPATCPPLM